jgi:predicted HTH domain antitoxin
MVLSVRLEKKEAARLAFMARKHHFNKSDGVKALMRRGFTMYQLDDYKSGNLSLGKLAENLDLSIFEAMNLVAKYNAAPDIPEDFLVESNETARALFRK